MQDMLSGKSQKSLYMNGIAAIDCSF